MLNASGIPEFNSSNLHITTFYKTQLLLLVFQDSILQKYDTTSLGNHIWAFRFNIQYFPILQGSKRAVIIILVLQCLRNLSIQLPSNTVLYPRRMEYIHSWF